MFSSFKVLNRTRSRACLVALILAAVGCVGERAEPSVVTYSPMGRSAILEVPPTIRADVPAPLVVMLHGYGGNSRDFGDSFGLREVAAKRGAFVLAPNGLTDSADRQFWNGTEACCDFDNLEPDDAWYIASLIDAVEAEWNVATEDIVLVGRDAGAFLAHTVSCVYSDRVAAMVSIAGASSFEFPVCADSPVRVLEVHGEDDLVIEFNGTREHPGASGSAARWSNELGCAGLPVQTEGRFDLVVDGLSDGGGEAIGSETAISKYADCNVGEVRLWTMLETGHEPTLRAMFAEELLNWAFDHP